MFALPRYGKWSPRDPMIPDEVGQTIRKADRERDKVLIAVLYITGARVSEIINLQRDDFAVKENELVVSVEPRKRGDSGSPLRKYSSLIFDREKTPFVEAIVDYLSGLGRNEFLFKSREGGHISRQRPWQITKEVNPDSSPHFYRHTRLSRLSKRGASQDLQKFSGRQTPPLKYVDVPESKMREIGRMVD